MKKKKRHQRARSAITGRFVSMTYAKRWPHRVVIERF